MAASNLITLISDDFNRADADPIGGSWNTLVSAWGLKIVSNMVEGVVASQRSAARQTTSLPDDQWSQLTLVTYPKDGVANIGPTVRSKSDDTSNFYAGLANSPNILQIYKYSASTGLTLLGTNAGITNSNGDVLRLEAHGSTLLLFQNGIQVLSVTDTEFSSGTAGINLSLSTNIGDVTVDDWSAGQFDAGLGGPRAKFFRPGTRGRPREALVQSYQGTTPPVPAALDDRPSRLSPGFAPGRRRHPKYLFRASVQGLPSVARPLTFRKTLSSLGTKTGSRQLHNTD